MEFVWLKSYLKEYEHGIDNILNAIQMGIITASTKERLESLETQKKDLLASIAQIELERPVYSKEAAEIEAVLCSDLTCLAPPKQNSIPWDGVL